MIKIVAVFYVVLGHIAVTFLLGTISHKKAVRGALENCLTTNYHEHIHTLTPRLKFYVRLFSLYCPLDGRREYGGGLIIKAVYAFLTRKLESCVEWRCCFSFRSFHRRTPNFGIRISAGYNGTSD